VFVLVGRVRAPGGRRRSLFVWSASRAVGAWPLNRALALALAVLGGALIVAGVAAIFWPAALIVAGVLLLAGLFGPFLG
jgi:hypothetical protein